jgi:hypothetical protein
MNEVIFIFIGVIVLVVGIYVYLGEKKRRAANHQTQQPWKSPENKKPRR